MHYVGIDLHKRDLVMAVEDDRGPVGKPRRLACRDEAAIVKAFRKLRPFRAVIEASSSYRWLYDLLEPLGTAAGARPLRPIQVIVNGEVTKRIAPANHKTERGARESAIDAEVELNGSLWIAVPVFEDRPDGRIRFAHTAPVHVEVPGKPLRPRRREVDYLIRRMEQELERNARVLRPAELDEYRQALRTYQEVAKTAR